MNKRLIITILKYGIGLAVLALVVWWNWEPSGNSPGIRGAFEREINYLPFLAAVGICICSLLLTFVRWYVLVRAQDLPFTLRDALRLGMVGYALSTFLPGSVGGDIIKAAFLAREQSRRTVAVATVVFDRILGLSGLFWLVAILGAVFWASGFFAGGLTDQAYLVLFTILVSAWIICGCCVLLWIVLGLISKKRSDSLARLLRRTPKIGGMLAELWCTMWLYRSRGKQILIAMALALIGHVGFVLVFYFTALTFFPTDAIPSLQEHYLTIPIGMVIQAGFPAPGGIGGGELAFGTLYRLIGFAAASGVLVSFVQRVVITWVLGLVGYITYLRLSSSLKPRPPAGADADAELVVSKV